VAEPRDTCQPAGWLRQLYFSPKAENRIFIILPLYQPVIAG